MATPPAIVDIMMSRFGREYQLCSLIGRLEVAPDLFEAIRTLETAIPGLIGAKDATYVTGTRAHVNHGRMLVQPIGRRAAIVARRAPHEEPFGAIEAATLASIVSAVAPTIDELYARF